MRGHGGMGGGMMGPMPHSGGMNSPTMDYLSDEDVLGKVYDHRVVSRLATYVRPYKKEALTTVFAVIVYTLGNVSIPC